MNNLKTLRHNAGMKQVELADLLKIAQATLSGWETGRFQIDNDNLFKLADYFNVTTDYLLGKSDISSPAELTIPDELRRIGIAFDRGEFEDLTQDEIDALAVVAKTLKSQRRL